MLAVLSDTHLSDDTTGRMIRDDAFKVFRDTLRDLAYDASWREDGKYVFINGQGGGRVEQSDVDACGAGPRPSKIELAGEVA